jgi:hypothetical protein
MVGAKREFNGGDPPSPYLQFVASNKTGDTNMLTKTKMVLAAALILGTASGALASASGNDTGAVLPGNGGANPVYHPKWFPNYARTHNAYRAYGFVQPSHHRTHER